MSGQRGTPGDIAKKLAGKPAQWPRGASYGLRADSGGWRRESFTLPRAQARQKARDWFDGFPKAAYMTEIEFWQELPGDMIAFTIRRLPSAD